MKMLLHACCGPCSLEPVRLLQERGVDMAIAYANANIAPREEYEHRLAELRSFAEGAGVDVLEGAYDVAAWEKTAGAVGESLRAGAPSLEERVEACEAESVAELLDDENRKARCRACYRMRLEEAARMAVDAGCDTLATTLAVSPYQFTDVIHEELDRAAHAAGLEPYFEDWRPYYDEGTARSRELGMYRQNYCGCRFSVEEGAATRAFIRKRNALRKQEERAAHADERAAEAAAAAKKAAERRAYNEKQARKRAVLKALRGQS